MSIQIRVRAKKEAELEGEEEEEEEETVQKKKQGKKKEKRKKSLEKERKSIKVKKPKQEEDDIVWDEETSEEERKQIEARLKKWVTKNGPMDFTHLYRGYKSNEDYARFFMKQYGYLPEYILKSVGGISFITQKPNTVM